MLFSKDSPFIGKCKTDERCYARAWGTAAAHKGTRRLQGGRVRGAPGKALLPGRLLPGGLVRGIALQGPLFQVVVLVQRVLPGD